MKDVKQALVAFQQERVNYLKRGWDIAFLGWRPANFSLLSGVLHVSFVTSTGARKNLEIRPLDGETLSKRDIAEISRRLEGVAASCLTMDRSESQSL